MKHIDVGARGRIVATLLVVVACAFLRHSVAGQAGLALDAVVAAGAAVAMVRAGRKATASRSRRAWRLQVSSPALWSLGAVTYLAGAPEAFWLVGRCAAVLAAGAAWWLTSRAVDSWSRVRLVVDGGLAAGSVFVVAWDTVWGPAWDASGGGVDGVVTLALPLGAVWIACLGFGLAATEMSGRHRRMPTLFGLSLLVIAYSDARWALDASPMWAVAWLLAAAATMSYVGTSARRQIISTRAAFTYTPYVLIAPVAGSYVFHRSLGGIPGPEISAGLVMLGLLIIRQHVTLVENRNLVATLAAAERRLRHQATHDHLTGLAGRAILWERLEQAERAPVERPYELAVLFIDLDDFKAVNDTFGHAAGDYVLVEVARAIESTAASVSSHALAVRMSGDEFAMLLTGQDALRSATVADSLLRRLQEPIEVGGGQVRVTASIGVATASSASVSPSALLRAADVAMYRIKHTGKGDVAVAERVVVTQSLPRIVPDAPDVSHEDPRGRASAAIAMDGNNPLARLRAVPGLTVTSDSLGADAAMRPEHYSGIFGVPGGADVSPHLRWSGAPEGTRSYVVAVYDPDAPTGSGIWHWVVANIPASTTELAEGAGSDPASLPAGAVTVLNDARLARYIGAAPPRGDGPHRYFMIVTGLDIEHVDFPPDVTPATLALITAGHETCRGVLIATGQVN